ncbi:tyrosine-type recombinase/integrase [Bifidobacterium simiarum]|uniref:Tyr recombinase domain-containing protein n=1 Tax=Bifidobacterium simiarum TaxID=2045441 RepID=A0A2M9HC49_9BIFI|nr:site-specific integrase [Bifidobacterium simiarum]PJM74398.1 hypothetical protein CSQ87_10365 [Bifidobacterium simiarum]
MARAWIEDRWLKPAEKRLSDGGVVRVDPPASVKRSLSMRMDDPGRAAVPEEFRTAAYGRGSRWAVYWRADGKRRRRSFRDYRDAEAFMAGLEDDIRSDRYVSPDDMERSFGEVARLWEATLSGGVKGSTEARYRRELRVWVLPRWGSVPLGRITTGALQAWVAQLVRGEAPRDGRIGQARPLAAKSIRSIVSIVTGAVFSHAMSEGWVLRNPVKGVKVPRQVPRVPRVYLTPEEIRAIAGQMRPADAACVYLLAYTGIRIGEMMALRCGDVDFDRHTIAVDRTQSVDADDRIVETLPKGNRTRRVPVPGSLTPLLAGLADGHGDDEYLVRAPRGGRQTTNNWRNRVWAPALRAAGMDGIEGLVIHSLRHSYASIAIRNGCDVKTLQSVMGHASAAETLDTYADLWPDRAGEVAEAIDGDILM